MLRLIFLVSFLLASAQSISADSVEGEDLLLHTALLVENELGISGVEEMMVDSRLVEVGEICKLAQYKFYPDWNGDRRFARPSDEVFEVMCRLPIDGTEWSCTVTQLTRRSLSELVPNEASCD